MTKKIFTAIVVFMLMIMPEAAYADIILYPKSEGNIKCSSSGDWQETDMVGYLDSSVYKSELPTSIEWEIRGVTKGCYRLYIWNSIAVDGCKNAKLSYTSEMRTEVTVPIDMSRGVSGWKEIGVYEIAGGGSSIKLQGNGGNVLFNALKLVPIDTETYRSFIKVANEMPDSIILKINRFNAFTEGKMATISDVAPMISEERTLVPVRFVTEAFGAGVKWNEDERSAEVTIGDKSLKFTLDSNEYLSNGETKLLDSPAKTVNDRLMLPIRYIAEEFGKEVFWDNSGLIIISDKLNNSLLNDNAIIEDIITIMEESIN